MRSLGADIWALTEVNPVSGPHHNRVVSSLIPGKAAAFAMITTSFAVTRIEVACLPTAAIGIVECTSGPLMVIALCMPWRPSAPPLPPGTVPADLPNRAHWAYVLSQLDSVIAGLSAEHPSLPVVVAGDFNQTITGYVVGSKKGRELLVNLINRHGLSAFTASLPSARLGSNAIDHLLGPAGWNPRARRHSPTVDGARTLSDHAAYTIEFPG